MRFLRTHLDLFGIVTSGLCAVHCLALPFLLSFGLLGGIMGGDHSFFDLTFLIVGVSVAILAILDGFRRHRNQGLVIVFLLSISLIFSGFLLDGTPGHVIMAFGGILMAIGHFRNRPVQLKV